WHGVGGVRRRHRAHPADRRDGQILRPGKRRHARGEPRDRERGAHVPAGVRRALGGRHERAHRAHRRACRGGRPHLHVGARPPASPGLLPGRTDTVARAGPADRGIRTPGAGGWDHDAAEPPAGFRPAQRHGWARGAGRLCDRVEVRRAGEGTGNGAHLRALPALFEGGQRAGGRGRPPPPAPRGCAAGSGDRPALGPRRLDHPRALRVPVPPRRPARADHPPGPRARRSRRSADGVPVRDRPPGPELVGDGGRARRDRRPRPAPHPVVWLHGRRRCVRLRLPRQLSCAHRLLPHGAAASAAASASGGTPGRRGLDRNPQTLDHRPVVHYAPGSYDRLMNQQSGTAVVTGGAGFLGSHLCDYLITRGHRVICMDNLDTGSLKNISHLRREDFVFVQHDVTRFIDVPEPVDFVYHLASPASPIDYARLPLQTLKVGSYGTHNALGLAKAKRARFLLTSTSEVYGDPHVHPQPESYWGNVNPIGPRGVYDEAKRYSEAMTMAYQRQQGVDTAIARIFNTYGPRMRPHDGRAIPTFVRQALGNKPITVFGDGSQTRSFCYVDDLVRGLHLLAASGEHLPVNIGNPGEFTVLEL